MNTGAVFMESAMYDTVTLDCYVNFLFFFFL